MKRRDAQQRADLIVETQLPRRGPLELPMLCTAKQVAAVMGLTPQQVRSLIRDQKIAYVRVAGRRMVPRDAIEEFIIQNTVKPCHGETPERACASSKSEVAFTSSGLKAVAAGSAARALRIASELKSPSQSSSPAASDPPARVIPLRSS
jgi:excisionase family DNA binding protein